jgi:hypothetical protein
MHVLAWPIAALAPLSFASTPTGLPIRWDTTPACVDATTVPARVAELVGTGSMPAGALGLGAEQSGEGWRISLVLEPAGDMPVRRTLEGRDCATLTEAVALVVAVHLDAVAAAGVIAGEETSNRRSVPPVVPPPVRAGSLSSEREDPTSTTVSRASDSRPRAPSRPRPRALASVGVAGEVGVLPRGAAALELAGGVGWPRARVEVGGLASLGPDGASERLAEVGGRFRLFTAVVRGCGVPGRERVELPLCGGLELGDLRATGTGLRRPATVDAPWVAVVASARPQWSPRLRAAGDRRRSRLAFGALLDLVVPLRRHRFTTPEAGLVHAVDPVAVRLGLRVELRLP